MGTLISTVQLPYVCVFLRVGTFVANVFMKIYKSSHLMLKTPGVYLEDFPSNLRFMAC